VSEQTQQEEMVFGFPEFAATVFQAYGPALRLTHAHSQLANELLASLPKTLNRDQAVVYMLVRLTIAGWVELLTLVGHGAGLGAMKIARGMFETSVMAEYLRQTPAEIDDYVEYAMVLRFKRSRQFPKALTAEQIAECEKEYLRVKPQFETNGKVRSQWHRHPISFMAEKVGRKDQYDVYSLKASIHHGNFEGLMAYLSGRTTLEIDQPPSLTSISQALVAGHGYLLQTLETLNDMLNLGFESKLKTAVAEFSNVWAKRGTTVG